MADFFEFYHLDVGKELARGTMSARLVLCLMEELPSNARTHWALGGYSPADRLSRTEAMLADLFDLELHVAMGQGGKKPSKKQLYPRPERIGDKEQKTKTVFNSFFPS